MVARQTVQVVNEHGVHTRPVSLFVDLASRFSSTIRVRNLTQNGEVLDGKSAMNLILLGAPCGTQLEIEAEGPDAEEAAASLARLVSDGFQEMKAGRRAGP